ncbi:MAG TPA: STAS domain-containing protein [Roseiarcus sp.]|nr:STAS domain-containing protein [Roseiarcus sp.]
MTGGNDSQAVICPMRTLYLPASLNAAVADTLAKTFRACRGDDLVIDAANVENVSAQCVEVLRAALDNWASDGRSLTLLNDSTGQIHAA